MCFCAFQRLAVRVKQLGDSVFSPLPTPWESAASPRTCTATDWSAQLWYFPGISHLFAVCLRCQWVRVISLNVGLPPGSCAPFVGSGSLQLTLVYIGGHLTPDKYEIFWGKSVKKSFHPGGIWSTDRDASVCGSRSLIENTPQKVKKLDGAQNLSSPTT